MIFTIFVYIVGVLLILKGFRLSYNTGTLRTRMSHPQMLVSITNRIIGSVYICIGVIIIIIMAKG